MSATIGDMQVEISRDWSLVGAEKRVAGFMRSSIHAAIIVPMLALLLLDNLRSSFFKIVITTASIMMVFWTTQKGSLAAFLLVLSVSVLPQTWRAFVLKSQITLAVILLITVPQIVPQFTMPSHAQGVFSFASFYMRIEEVWPEAWRWIARNEIFPFGVGLGGIGGAMRIFAPAYINYADNLFIFLYAYFGMMSFLYLGWLWWQAISYSVHPLTHKPATPQQVRDDNILPLQLLSFLLFYGSVISLIEDQMAALFLGAALAALRK